MKAVNIDVTLKGATAFTEIDFTREDSPLYSVANALLRIVNRGPKVDIIYYEQDLK